MNVLVLGATGMLGSMVYNYLKSHSVFNVIGTSRKRSKDLIHFDVHAGFINADVNLEDMDYVINCIGITKPYCHDGNMDEVKNAVIVNSLFPHALAELAEKKGFRIIQIATDCVYSGAGGKYAEDSLHDALDVYGKTKSLGEVISNLFLNIRCSIIGPERFNKVFLLEWFFAQSKGSIVNGFSNHLWNGVTTFQFAKLCKEIMCNEKFDILVSQSSIHHFVPNDTVSKYELLCLFNKIFDKGLIVNKYEGNKGAVDRALTSNYNTIASFYPNSTIEKEVKELKKHINETGFYNV